MHKEEPFDYKKFKTDYLEKKNTLSIKEAWWLATTEDVWKLILPAQKNWLIFDNKNYQEECILLANLSPVFKAKLNYGNGANSFESFFVDFIKKNKILSDKKYTEELSEFVVSEFKPISIYNLLSETDFVNYLMLNPSAQAKLIECTENLLDILLEDVEDQHAAEIIKLFLSKKSPLFEFILNTAGEKQLKNIMEKYPHLDLYENKGCDLHLMLGLPDIEDYRYKGSYIWLKNTKKLYYAQWNKFEGVQLNDIEVFKKVLKEGDNQHLTAEEIKESITLNGGHTQKTHYCKVLALIESLNVEEIISLHKKTDVLNRVLQHKEAFVELDVLQILKILKVELDSIFRLFLDKLEDWLKLKQQESHFDSVYKIFHLFSNKECTDKLLKKLISALKDETINILLWYFAEKYEQVSPIATLKLLETNRTKLVQGISQILHQKSSRMYMLNILRTSNCNQNVATLFFSAIHTLLNDNEYLTTELIQDKVLFTLFLKSEHNFIKSAYLSACKRNATLAKQTLIYIVENLADIAKGNSAQKMQSVELVKTILSMANYDSFITYDRLIALINLDKQLNEMIFLEANLISKIASGVPNFQFSQLMKVHCETLLASLAKGASLEILKFPGLSILQEHLRLTTLKLFNNMETHAQLLIKLFTNPELRQHLFRLMESQELLLLANTGDEQVLQVIFWEDFAKSHENLFDHFILRSFKNIKNFKLAEKIFKQEALCKRATQFLKLKDLEQVLSHPSNIENEKFFDLLLEYVDHNLLTGLFEDKHLLAQIFIKIPLFRDKVIQHTHFKEISVWYEKQQSALQTQLRTSGYFSKSELPKQGVASTPSKLTRFRQTPTVPRSNPVLDSSPPPPPPPLPPRNEVSNESAEQLPSPSNDSIPEAPPPPPPGNGSIPPPPPPPSLKATTAGKKLPNSGVNLLTQLTAGVKLKEVVKKDNEESEPSAQSKTASGGNDFMAELKKKQAARTSRTLPVSPVNQNGATNKVEVPKVVLKSTPPRDGNPKDTTAPSVEVVNANGFHKLRATSSTSASTNPAVKSSTPNQAPFGKHILKRVPSKTTAPPPGEVSTMQNK